MHHAYDKCPNCPDFKRKTAKLCRNCRYLVGETKVCRGPCGRELPVGAFRIRTRANPKPRSNCLECEAAAERRRYEALPPEKRHVATRRWEKNNPEKVLLQSRRTRIRMLGLAHEMDRILALFQTQTHCPICNTPVTELSTSLHIDHDHDTGAFRALICTNCNLGIGHFDDSPALLRAAAEYLERSRIRAA